VRAGQRLVTFLGFNHWRDICIAELELLTGIVMTDQTIWASTTMEEPDDLAKPVLEYVGFWLRFGAAVVDTIVLLVVMAPLTYTAFGRFWDTKGGWVRGPFELVITWVVPAVLVITLWYLIQATPGKLAIGARIVDANTGKKPSTARLIVRYLGYFLASFPLGLGLLWVAFDRRKQGWHDKLANTVVVRVAGRDRAQFSD
jgi:uncharacterized RDD family membrane protein YckC